MKVLGVEHIGIAVKDLDESIMTFKQALGLDSVARAKVEASGVEVAVIPCGDTKIELVKPLGPDSPVSRFIEKGGSPIHHICFKVEGLEEGLRSLKRAGVSLIDEKPRPGAFGHKIAFVRPGGGLGFLVELSEET